ncbi:DNA-directed RNA polymerase subunit beta [Alkalibacillus aidingensis]|uniref:DNA-directed RNA polymerase subunit beta n=1 Tax=Alkalibacillus aidingensis TaxID=2747607 RepID=UPI00166123B5|nr:DNA-directed RNA polymerase subunit beta [Alkalibacillus aidingensis]
MTPDENQPKSRRLRGAKKFIPKLNFKRKQSEPSEDKTTASQRKLAKAEKKKARKLRRGRIQYIPGWLRVIIVLIASIAALLVGLMVGYGVIGDGGDPSDALDRSLWQGFYDYIRGK